MDAVETLTGYDLLALLPDEVESAVESEHAAADRRRSRVRPARLPKATRRRSTPPASLDPNGTIVSYAWDFGDGTTGSGASVAHTYAQDGAFTVRVTVTDNDGLTDTATFTVNVTNVAPVVGAVPDATLNVGATYTAAGTFTDPGADAWTATVELGRWQRAGSGAVERPQLLAHAHLHGGWHVSR